MLTRYEDEKSREKAVEKSVPSSMIYIVKGIDGARNIDERGRCGVMKSLIQRVEEGILG